MKRLISYGKESSIMANPLPNEAELYKRIEKENISIHPIVWELLSHHLGNDLYMISMIIESTVLNKIKPKPITTEDARKVLDKVMVIKDFLTKLRKATKKEAGF